MNKFFALLAGVVLLAGCGDGGTALPSNVKVPDFSMSLTPEFLSLDAGSSGTVTVGTSKFGGFSDSITFSVSGANVGSAVTQIAASVSEKTVTFNIGAGVPSGSYPMLVTGTAGATLHSSVVRLYVTAAAAPDFSLSAASSTVGIGAGNTGSINLNLVPTGGFSGTVNLAITGTIIGTGADKISASSSFSNNVFTVSLGVGANVPVGVYALTATGTAGNLIRTANFSVTVLGPNAIDSNTNATNQRGKNGQQFSYTCPANITLNSVWGTDTYTDDSRICSAAIHAGKITQAGGGLVTIEIAPGQASYVGSSRNGVTSSNYGSWIGSYFFK
jgi:LCCL domain